MKIELEKLVAFAKYIPKPPKVKNRIILDGYHFTYDDILQLQKIKFDTAKLTEAIESRDSPHYVKFFVEKKCAECGQIHVVKINRADLIDLLKNKRVYPITCDSCKIPHQLRENTLRLLRTDEAGNGMHIYDWNIIESRSFDEKIILSTIAKSRNYDELLKMWYWRIISAKLRSNGKCAHCGVTKNLHVHHKTYKHHGCEHLHLEDLEVLCEECHEKEHIRIKLNDSLADQQPIDPVYKPRMIMEINETTDEIEQNYINEYAFLDLMDTIE
jgi:hypothetical protein